MDKTDEKINEEVEPNVIGLSRSTPIILIGINRVNRRAMMKNWCSCGSGKKFKNCCFLKKE